MRPLPLSVWKARRMTVKVSLSCGFSASRGQMLGDGHHWHLVRLFEEDAQQFGIGACRWPSTG